MNKITKILFSLMIATAFSNAQATWPEYESMEEKKPIKAYSLSGPENPLAYAIREKFNIHAHFIHCKSDGKMWKVSEEKEVVGGINVSRLLTVPYDSTINVMALFRFEQAGDGVYKIRNIGTGRILSDDLAKFYPEENEGVNRHSDGDVFFVEDKGEEGKNFFKFIVKNSIRLSNDTFGFQSIMHPTRDIYYTAQTRFSFASILPDRSLKISTQTFWLSSVSALELEVVRLRAHADERAVRIIQENEALRATVVAQADKMEILLQMVLDLQTEVRARPDEGDDAATVEGSGFTAGAKVRQWAQNVLAGMPVKDAPPLDKGIDIAASISDSEASRLARDRDVDAELALL